MEKLIHKSETVKKLSSFFLLNLRCY